MGGSNTTTSQQTSTNTLPQWMLQAYQNVGSQATGIVDNPTTGLPNSLPALQETASQTPEFQSYLSNSMNAANIGNNLSNANAFSGYSSNIQAPNIGNSFNGFNSNISTTPVTASGWNSDVASQYMNPYTSQVLQAQQGLANQNYGQQMSQENQSAAASGAVGGDRSAINQQTLTHNFNLEQQNLQANALQSAYQNSQNAFNNDANRNLQAGVENSQLGLAAATQNANLNFGALNAGNQVNMANANLGYQAQNANNEANLYGMSGTNALNEQAAGDTLSGITQGGYGATAAQSYQQTQLNNDYQNALNQYLFPEQQLSYLQGIYQPMASSLGINQTDGYQQQTQSAMSAFMGILDSFASGAGKGLGAAAMA